MKAVTPTLGICILAVVAAVVAAIGDFGGSSSPSKVYGGTPTIAIQDFRFSTALVTAGAVVTVKNLDSAPHTVTADDGSFDSDVVEAGTDGSFTAPSTPGSYPLHCDVHPSMVGTLVVAAP
jgi:plastocyanin